MDDSIVQQLRDRAYAFKATDRLSEQAADEIERLQRQLAARECNILKHSLLELIEKWDSQAFLGGCSSGLDSETDRKSAATPRACASSCSQPFDSAPTTHDAVPEAKAYADGEPAPTCGGEAGISPRDGTGNTPSPESYDQSDEKRVNTTTHRDASVRGEGTVGERLVERLSIAQTLLDDNERLRAEIARLRNAIRRLADQDATLSVQGGNVIVDMECQDLLQKNLTAEEREALRDGEGRRTIRLFRMVATLCRLLERTV